MPDYKQKIVYSIVVNEMRSSIDKIKLIHGLVQLINFIIRIHPHFILT